MSSVHPFGLTHTPSPMSNSTTPARNDALARASALANRARDLRRAQAEVKELTTREVQVLARTAASFFDAIPLAEFTSTLLPQSARNLRRIRHRILHRTIHNTNSGTLIRALLLGRDGSLRLFTARSADSRDLLLILEPGRTLPVGLMRDVVDWTPMLRVPGFRPFEILDKLSHALDAVEERIHDAEQRVAVQKKALTSGDLSALLPSASEDTAIGAPVLQRALPATVPVARSTAPDTRHPDAGAAVSDPFGMFDMVEAVAAAAEPRDLTAAITTRVVLPKASVATGAASVLPQIAAEAEPDEWDEPVEAPVMKPPAASNAVAARALFPVMPAPRQ